MDNNPCPYCNRRGVYPYEHVAALGLFEDSLKELIHHMKYHRRWGIAEELAERLSRLPRARSLLESAEVLVPVPLWRWRQVSRGYNQADVIACHLARRFNKPICRAVARVRRTVSQTELRSTKGRTDNVHGAFRLKSGKTIKDRRVIAIDDVMTSGATLKEVGRTLLDAEPAGLSAIVLAVADPRGRAFQAI